jgi:hypothetical protein
MRPIEQIKPIKPIKQMKHPSAGLQLKTKEIEDAQSQDCIFAS